MVINGVELNPLDVNAWPTVPWKNLEIRAWSHPLVPEELGQQQIEREVMRWGGSVFGAILALAGVDEAVESEEEWPSEPEGSRTTGLINRYERSPVNRAACIAALGATCRACGFDFGAVYGDAAEGFIHVHHVTPVSQLGAGYRVDPVRDLVPVCPNCHAFIHLREPPYTVQEVRMILHARRT